MKSCNVFILVSVLLILQSCKTTSVKKTNLDSLTSSKILDVSESDYFHQFVKKWNKDMTIKIRNKKPVVDSTGKIISEFIDQEIDISISENEETDNVSREIDNSEKQQDNKSKINIIESVEEKSHPPWSDFVLILFLILLIVLFFKLR